jgi:hypothetical protein
VLRLYSPRISVSLTAFALLATGLILRADNPPAPQPPPGFRVVYHSDGNGNKIPIFVKDAVDPLGHAQSMEDDPLDHQRVFSEANPMGSKAFLAPNASNLTKASSSNGQDAFTTKVYDTTSANSVYNLGSKSTFNTSPYNGLKSAAGYDQSYATKAADVAENQQAATEFAAIGSPDQNRVAPVPASTYDTSSAPGYDKKFTGPEEDARHRSLTKLSNGQMLVEDIPDRPLTVDEVKNLINHGFKPNTTQPPSAASRPLNDPNYQPEPLRIEPTEPETPTPAADNQKVHDDDANDPVPSPGTMAEPLPNK